MKGLFGLCKLLGAIALFGLPDAALYAADPPPSSKPAKEASAADSSSAPEQASEQTPEVTPARAPATERFDPSEKISEDLSVSFPSDI